LALAAHARLCLAAGDRAGYCKACATLIQASAAKDGPRPADVARLCILAPQAVTDLEPLRKQAARRAAEKRAGSPDLCILGGLLLRANRAEEAVKRLKKAVKERGDGGAVHEELLLALAYQRLGKNDEARHWLTRATAWLDGPQQAVQAAADLRGRGLGWQAWLELEILRREAERLLKGHRKQPQKARSKGDRHLYQSIMVPVPFASQFLESAMDRLDIKGAAIVATYLLNDLIKTDDEFGSRRTEDLTTLIGRLSPRPFSTQELVDFLKQPTWVGPARRIVLDQLEKRYHRKFADLWDFVAWAKKHLPGLDLTSPPKRVFK
jgi:tetratricopeptide (TPR) repeat protein